MQRKSQARQTGRGGAGEYSSATEMPTPRARRAAAHARQARRPRACSCRGGQAQHSGAHSAQRRQQLPGRAGENMNAALSVPSLSGSNPKSPGRLPVRCAGASPPGSLMAAQPASAKRLGKPRARIAGSHAQTRRRRPAATAAQRVAARVPPRRRAVRDRRRRHAPEGAIRRGGHRNGAGTGSHRARGTARDHAGEAAGRGQHGVHLERRGAGIRVVG